MNTTKTYIKATSVQHALTLAKENEESFSYLAGGTDVLVNKFQGNEEASALIDITAISHLKNITLTSDYIRIGSLVTLEELINNKVILAEYPILSEAARSVASPVIRKSATLGGNLLCENRCTFYNQSEWWRNAAGRCLKCKGNICLASGGAKFCYSKFVSDTAVALISLYAELEITDINGDSIIPLENIYSGDGLKPHLLSETAIIQHILIPRINEIKTSYHKLRKRETLDFTSLTTAVSINKEEKIRIVLGGVHAKPILMEGSASDDLELLINQAVSTTRIVDNDTYSRSYRKEMIRILLTRSFKKLNLDTL